MVIHLSTKGQIVIPKTLRDKLGLQAGAEFAIYLEGNRIILEPQDHHTLLDSMVGRFAHEDFLAELEAEHRQELAEE